MIANCQFDYISIGYKLFRFLNTINISKQCKPKGLTLTFLVTSVFPIFGKLLRSFLLSISHDKLLGMNGIE